MITNGIPTALICKKEKPPEFLSPTAVAGKSEV